MTPIFRYNASRQVLVEQARMKKPTWGAFFDSSDIEEADQEREDYESHLNSLREYPVAPGDWKEDVGYVESVNFRLQYECFIKTVWTACTISDYHLTDSRRRRVVAIPVSPPERTYSRSELLAEVEKAWEAGYNSGLCTPNKYHFDRKQYFSQTFNHDI